jgi:hypothetical protein
MKKMLLLISFLLYLIPSSKAQFIYETSFKTAAEFDQFTQYNLDGLKPYNNNWGNKAWIRLQFDANTIVAASTSYYSPAGKANDWLVSPPISIPAGSTVGLSWAAVAFDSEWSDGYKVYISTTGNQISDFTTQPVFSVSEENPSLTYRYVPLSAYAGKTIYIAWVNDSYDQFILGVTDITIGASKFSISPDIPTYVQTDEVTVKGTLTNLLNPITSFTAHYTVNGETYSQQFNNLNIAGGTKYSFQFDRKISLPNGGSAAYEVWVSTDGYTTPKKSGLVARVAEQYLRKIVGEEATGTWCGWCPRGAVYMAYMKNTYPDFLGIAVHNDDPMEVTEYDAAVSAKVAGYPSGLINRTIEADPSNFEYYYNQLRNSPTPVKIKLSAKFTDKTKNRIVANIQSDFAVNYTNTADFKLSIVVSENNVKGTSSGYAQSNYYSGGSYGTMGEYASLPATVPASQMVYQDVARALFGTFNGFEESIPKTIAIGSPVNYTYTFDLPSSVSNVDNIEVTAFIIDSKTGEILNGDRVAASGITVTAIQEIQLSGLTVNAYKNSPETIAIDIETENEKAVSYALFGLDGKLVKEIAPTTIDGFHRFEIPSNGLNGIYLIRVKAGQQIVTKKVIF